MKKFLFIATTLALAGCQTTIPENSYTNSINESTSKTKILPLSKDEKSKDNPGVYPLQYRYIISNYTNSNIVTLFKPILYNTSNYEKGWGTCVKINNQYRLFILKNNAVLEDFKSPNLNTVCESLKITQEKHDDESFTKHMEKSVEKFKKVVDDESQSHLFGTPPSNPEGFILNQLTNFIPNSSQAKLKDISVRKTFFLLNDEMVYSYLIFANLITFNNQGVEQTPRKSIFYYKNGAILNHKIFNDESSSKKGEILKNMFDEDVDTSEPQVVSSPENITKQSSVKRPPKRLITPQNNSSTKKQSNTQNKAKAKPKATTTKKSTINNNTATKSKK